MITPARTEEILTEEEIHSIFSVLESIYRINAELLKRLEASMEHYDEDETMIGSVFLELVSYC